jgi:hypothetical protein
MFNECIFELCIFILNDTHTHTHIYYVNIKA